MKRTYTNPTTGQTYDKLRRVPENYETNELGGEENGVGFTEEEYNPNFGAQIGLGAVLPGLIGGGIGALAGAKTGNAGAGAIAGALPGLTNAAKIGANALEYYNPDSKLAAMGAGALSTAGAGLQKGFMAGLDNGGNVGQSMLEGLAQAGTGALQGGISAVPGMKPLGDMVNPLVQGAAQGNFANAAMTAAQTAISSPEFGSDLGKLSGMGDTGKWGVSGDWGSEYGPQMDMTQASQGGNTWASFMKKGPDGKPVFDREKFESRVPNAYQKFPQLYRPNAKGQQEFSPEAWENFEGNPNRPKPAKQAELPGNRPATNAPQMPQVFQRDKARAVASMPGNPSPAQLREERARIREERDRIRREREERKKRPTRHDVPKPERRRNDDDDELEDIEE